MKIMMNKIGYIIILITLALFTSQSHAYGYEKDLGLGIVLGEPTGITADIPLNNRSSIDITGAWSFDDEGSFHIHSDYKYVFYQNTLDYGNQLRAYFGVGGRFKDKNDKHDEVRLGVRVPVGLSLFFAKYPIETFLEVAPIVDVVEETDGNFNAGLGARYYF